MSMLPAAASADVNSDKTRVAQLEQQLSADGVVVQQAVEDYDRAQAHELATQSSLDATRARLAQQQHQQAKDMTTLRGLALDAYMTSSNENSDTLLFQMGNPSELAAQQEYAHLATSSLRDAVDTVVIDEQQTQATEVQLQGEESDAQASVAAAANARSVANAALARDDALLGKASSDLNAAEAALAALREREEEAQATESAAQQGPISFNPSPGSYTNPLRAIRGLTPQRVDQGVDYDGYGPITAIGDGVVLSTTNSGWPGGTFISYRLTDGRAGGLVVYAAEDIEPTVSVGQSVNAGTVLGNMYEGSDGIETGWADSSGDGNTMARDAGQFNGSNSTAYGANFSQLLQSLGAPPGVMQNEPPTGSLPPNWPTW